MSEKVAAQMIKDELKQDADPGMNLASFVTTSMDKKAKELIMESLDKNYVDMDEYPATTELQDRSRYNEFKVSEGLRRHQFIVPAYHMSADAKHVALLRVVIRGYFSRTKTEGLLSCINAVLKELDELHPVAAIQENGHHKLSLKGVANGNGELPPAAAVENGHHIVCAKGAANGNGVTENGQNGAKYY
ncbi:glutamate decarboxylase 4 [Pyrus ussuriensis x Pyrus communis]|uniref:Glutamate decarboxylase 4 n=1 Tax=Pyrus ussuriensis x Pyrus communis TaxID=2448454 RepID=A0A5N5HAE6_9ROSA|nr:glutamate decarboxylase 4 [Pyrus ussuriensis x Pyrus communis]KAB2620312.1 glutamate decarboxylase 4 [Pyrus ussuriensis x Pyrus communis]